MSSLVALRQQLAELLEPVTREADRLPTGLAALDAALPGSGIPRGRVTEIVGRAGSGKTTLVRCVVEETVGRGIWVAYVDAGRTLAPRDWAHLGEAEGVWMIRPREAARAAWCADVLLRSGAFGLVVLDGAPALTRQIAVRLSRLARQTNTALVAVGEDASRPLLGGAVRLRTTGQKVIRGRRRAEWLGEQGGVRRIVVAVEKGGTYRTVEVSCAIGVARRVCPHPEVPDRRGVPPSRAARTAIARARSLG